MDYEKSENLAGKLSYDAEDGPNGSAEFSIYLFDKASDLRYALTWILTLSLKNLRGIVFILEEHHVEDCIPFEGGELYYDNEGNLSYNSQGLLSLELELNKTLFVKLLKEYEELLRTAKSANVYIRDDMSVDKVPIGA